MYSGDRFLAYANKNLNAHVSTEAIDEVRKVNVEQSEGRKLEAGSVGMSLAAISSLFNLPLDSIEYRAVASFARDARFRALLRETVDRGGLDALAAKEMLRKLDLILLREQPMLSGAIGATGATGSGPGAIGATGPASTVLVGRPPPGSGWDRD
jgi:hypothetical protein